MTKIAAVRVRGSIGVSGDKEKALRSVRLFNKNYCVILDSKPEQIGILNKAKDYITWGELKENTFILLLEKRGRLAGNQRLTEQFLKDKKLDLNQFTKDFFNNKKTLKDIPGLKLFFRLSPPLKGFERGGIKKPYSLGGALGYRKDSINDLIQRMI